MRDCEQMTDAIASNVGCRKRILFVIPGMDAGIQLSWKATTDGGIHPCNLDPSIPCRDDDNTGEKSGAIQVAEPVFTTPSNVGWVTERSDDPPGGGSREICRIRRTSWWGRATDIAITRANARPPLPDLLPRGRVSQKSVQDFATHGKEKVRFFLSSQKQRLVVVVSGSTSLCCRRMSKSYRFYDTLRGGEGEHRRGLCVFPPPSHAPLTGAAGGVVRPWTAGRGLGRRKRLQTDPGSRARQRKQACGGRPFLRRVFWASKKCDSRLAATLVKKHVLIKARNQYHPITLLPFGGRTTLIHSTRLVPHKSLIGGPSLYAMHQSTLSPTTPN